MIEYKEEGGGKLPTSLYTKKGKRAVILLHAYTGSPNDVRMLFRSLERANYTVYAPLFSGHATDDAQTILAQSVTSWYEETKAAIEKLKGEGFQQIAILGLSMGGLFAMTALSQNAELIGGGAFCSPIMEVSSKIPRVFLRYAESQPAFKKLPEEEQGRARDHLKELIQAQYSELEGFVAKYLQQLTAINQPVFLAQAGKDQLIDPLNVYDTAKQLSQTKVTLQWYPESGHVLTVGPERKEFEKDVLAFLDSLSWNEANENEKIN